MSGGPVPRSNRNEAGQRLDQYLLPVVDGGLAIMPPPSFLGLHDDWPPQFFGMLNLEHQMLWSCRCSQSLLGCRSAVHLAWSSAAGCPTVGDHVRWALAPAPDAYHLHALAGISGNWAADQLLAAVFSQPEI